MTSLSDFPPDVQAAASKAHAEFASGSCRDNLGVIIARAIVEDRAGRISVQGLTAQQADCLRFIARFQRDHEGISPSFDQIKAALDLSSKSVVTWLLDRLEERGRIKRMPGRARAITIIPTPAIGA